LRGEDEAAQDGVTTGRGEGGERKLTMMGRIVQDMSVSRATLGKGRGGKPIKCATVGGGACKGPAGISGREGYIKNAIGKNKLPEATGGGSRLETRENEFLGGVLFSGFRVSFLVGQKAVSQKGLAGSNWLATAS